MGKVLKAFMQHNFHFSTLKKIGFYRKEIKFNDYEAQAKRVCQYFNLESIYDYGKHEVRCHLSLAGPPMSINDEGKLKCEKFISVVHPNQMHI